MAQQAETQIETGIGQTPASKTDYLNTRVGRKLGYPGLAALLFFFFLVVAILPYVVTWAPTYQFVDSPPPSGPAPQNIIVQGTPGGQVLVQNTPCPPVKCPACPPLPPPPHRPPSCA